MTSKPWLILRKGRQDRPERVRRYSSEEAARAAYEKIDVRQGYAMLIGPDDRVVAKQSGPFAVRMRW